MSEQDESAVQPVSGWRLKLGVVLFVLSIIVPVAGIPFVAALDFSVTMKSTVSGFMLAGAEVLGLVAIAVMGKPGFIYIKGKMWGILKRYAPPDRVSRTRYTIGLVMFCLPLVFGWISIYVVDYFPWLLQNQVPLAMASDGLFLVSLFVLGGDFWDKIRALFVFDMEPEPRPL